ncbi:hypothetical protein H0H81_008444 [Sphagnurus paluster]|uniref:Protein transport protein SFT2 n=1 Tax=Sphagnurus paluster TaxID=117069 RepID=A0A9P7FXJ7_9AGAR|nr:hypothetical protein H0H81_008444 [Sphagnurus paluster]
MAPASSEQSFRNNLSQFRWARGNTDDSQPPPAPVGNPFSRFYNAVAGDYIPLRSSERSNEDEAWFALSSWERMSNWGGCVLLRVVLDSTPPCITVCLSVLECLDRDLKTFLRTDQQSPINHFKHLISAERLPFSAIYFGSLGLTLYFSLGAHSYIGSLICGAVQVVALVAYVLAYFPGGTQTLRLGGQLALRGAGGLLPR